MYGAIKFIFKTPLQVIILKQIIIILAHGVSSQMSQWVISKKKLQTVYNVII